jgi:hypothetical protein
MISTTKITNNNIITINNYPKTILPIIDSEGNITYHWNRTIAAKLFGPILAEQLCGMVYSPIIAIIRTVIIVLTITLWMVGLFQLIPSQLMLATSILGATSVRVNEILQCDTELVQRTLLNNLTVFSTLVLVIIYGLMVCFILDWDLRGISSLIIIISGVIWSFLVETIPNVLRLRSATITRVSTAILLIIVAVIINLGLIPQQLPPSEVTFISISSVGRYPLSIDAYAILNQSITTWTLLELNGIVHARKGELMFVRIHLKGKDAKYTENADVPDWLELAKRYSV